MGDTSVNMKYGTTPHQISSPSSTSSKTNADGQSIKSNDKDVKNVNKTPTKYEILKQRKLELEKKLNEKYSLLQQIRREEAQLIGMYPPDFSVGIGSSDQNNFPTLRRKIGTSFKLPENLLNNNDDVNKLLLEKQIQQQISEASLRLSNDTAQTKSIRRTHKQNFEMAQQKLLAINQNLSILKKRQQMSPPKAVKDDIDLHKTSHINRYRSNSNSSSMMTMNTSSERRNSIKSTTSSNLSNNTNNNQLMVQIPIQYQQNNHHHPQQISPYSINNNNNILSMMPSGSQTMTPSTSSAMVSQLNMLKQRSRHESFSNFINYDINSNESVKLSPVTTHSHHHHNHYNQQQNTYNNNHHGKINKMLQQQINYSNTYAHSPPAPLPPPPAPHYYVSSPPMSSASHQQFLYDNKVINRLQQQQHLNHHQVLSDQNYCPNTLSSSYDEFVVDKLHQSYHSNHSEPASPQQQQPQPQATTMIQGGGLGGYWMLLENNEKVWCAVDNRYSSLDRKQNQQVKLTRNPTSVTSHRTNNVNPQQHTPTKSTSLGNFDFINKHDDATADAVSVTSASSENKKREKVWRETSLDGPIIKHKSSTLSSVSPSPSSVSNSYQMLHVNTNHHNSSYVNYQQASPVLMSPPPPPQPRYYQQPPPPPPLHPHNRNSQLYQNSNDHFNNLPANYFQGEPHNHQHHHNNNNVQKPVMSIPLPQNSDSLISPTPSSASGNTITSPVSPTPSTAAAAIIKSPDIQTESPKNMTVVQQGKILPYKEVTKPFEMSDFYKYSTKFRQKQQMQQQQQQQQQQQHDSDAGVNQNNNQPIQKIVYQPPNPSICHPINYN